MQNILDDLKKVDEQVIPTTIVGGIVLKNLKEVDEIAFLKYAIVHNNYSSMKDFMGEIEKLKNYSGLDYGKDRLSITPKETGSK